MIYPESLSFEESYCKECKYRQCDNLLNNFKLPYVERTSVLRISNPVGRYLKNIFKKCNSSAQQDYRYESKTTEPVDILEFKMTIPCECHKSIGKYQQYYGK